MEWAPRCLWSQRLWRVQFKVARNVLLRKYLVNAARKQLGFHMTTDEMLDGLRNLPTMQCTDASICPVPYDAPSTYVQGAPLILHKSEGDGSFTPAADLAAWLAQAAGDDGAPVYAGWGSMAIMTDALALKLANACRRASRRLVLLISWSKLITLGEGAHELSADGRTLTPCAIGEASGTTEPSGAPSSTFFARWPTPGSFRSAAAFAPRRCGHDERRFACRETAGRRACVLRPIRARRRDLQGWSRAQAVREDRAPAHGAVP